MSLDVAVCMKVVPKPEEVAFNPESKTLDRGKAENVLNPSDKAALETALRLREAAGGKVTIVSMGPPFAKGFIELGLAMGADAGILASDRLFAGSDTYPTSLVLARLVKLMPRYDVVLCGEESADASTGQVPQGIAEWLGVPIATFVDSVRIDGRHLLARRTTPDRVELLSLPLPCVLSVTTETGQARFPDFERLANPAISAAVRVVGAADLRLTEAETGLKASYTLVSGLVEGKSRTRKRRFIEGSAADKAKAVAEALKPYLP